MRINLLLLVCMLCACKTTKPYFFSGGGDIGYLDTSITRQWPNEFIDTRPDTPVNWSLYANYPSDTLHDLISMKRHTVIFGEVVTDTIPVMILYCDTGRQYHLFPGTKWLNDSVFRYVIDTLYIAPDNTVHWLKGYETCLVDPQGSYIGNTESFILHPSYAHIAYLDADKKPLKRSVVVWMAQQIGKP